MCDFYFFLKGTDIPTPPPRYRTLVFKHDITGPRCVPVQTAVENLTPGMLLTASVPSIHWFLDLLFTLTLTDPDPGGLSHMLPHFNHCLCFYDWSQNRGLHPSVLWCTRGLICLYQLMSDLIIIHVFTVRPALPPQSIVSVGYTDVSVWRWCRNLFTSCVWEFIWSSNTASSVDTGTSPQCYQIHEDPFTVKCHSTLSPQCLHQFNPERDSESLFLLHRWMCRCYLYCVYNIFCDLFKVFSLEPGYITKYHL